MLSEAGNWAVKVDKRNANKSLFSAVLTASDAPLSRKAVPRSESECFFRGWPVYGNWLTRFMTDLSFPAQCPTFGEDSLSLVGRLGFFSPTDSIPTVPLRRLRGFISWPLVLHFDPSLAETNLPPPTDMCGKVLWCVRSADTCRARTGAPEWWPSPTGMWFMITPATCVESSRGLGMILSSSACPKRQLPRVTGMPEGVVIAGAVPRNPRRPPGFFLAALHPLWPAGVCKCEQGVATIRRFVSGIGHRHDGKSICPSCV